MDKGTIGWLHNTAKREHWRVAPWLGLDDLVQEGVMCYYKVLRRYGRRDKKHMMALFKTTYTNHIHRLAQKKTNQIDDAVGEVPSDIICPDSEMDFFVAEAPELVKRTVRALMRAPEVMARAYVRGPKGRETTHERLCALAGVSPDSTPDLPKQIRDYLTT